MLQGDVAVDEVELALGVRQTVVGEGELDVSRLELAGVRLRLRQHGRRDVEPDDAPELGRQRKGEAADSAAVIQRSSPRKVAEVPLVAFDQLRDEAAAGREEFLAVLVDPVGRELLVGEHSEIGRLPPEFLPRLVGTQHAGHLNRTGAAAQAVSDGSHWP